MLVPAVTVAILLLILLTFASRSARRRRRTSSSLFSVLIVAVVSSRRRRKRNTLEVNSYMSYSVFVLLHDIPFPFYSSTIVQRVYDIHMIPFEFKKSLNKMVAADGDSLLQRAVAATSRELFNPDWDLTDTKLRARLAPTALCLATDDISLADAGIFS